LEHRVGILKAVGEAVRHFRTGGHGKNKAQYTQEQLTEMVRRLSRETEARGAVASETISRIENGRTNPTIKQINWICKALDVSLSEFFRYVESQAGLKD
jgi:transcriptional regulator with XRE-family HTH domain